MNESVAIIIFDENKNQVLLIKRRDIPVWVLPGGGIEKNETPEEAALREATEETGYTLELVRKIAEYTPLNRLTRFTHFYEARIIGGAPALSSETKEIAFFSLKALPKYLPSFYLHWIQDAHSHRKNLLKKPIYSTGYLYLIKYLLSHPLLTIRFLLTRLGIHFNT